MKTIVLSLLISYSLVTMPTHVNAQSQEIQQLVLNWKKLQQLRDILDNMYQGYQILTKGYNTIKDISEGNFNLHQLFLDGLLEVNPNIRDYYKIPIIIRYQLQLVERYKQAWDYFKNDPNLTLGEITYIGNVYSGLFRRSLKNLDELLMVTTSSTLRMGDDERLQTIDRIYLEMEDKLAFLQYFNSSTRLLVVQRAKALNDITTQKKLNEVNW